MSRDTDNELPPELRALEAELASLVPRVDGLDDACLMFVAGRASVRKPRATGLVWPAAFGGMTLVAAALAVLLLMRPTPEVVERIVRVPVEPAPADVAANQEEASPSLARHEPAPERAIAESGGAPREPLGLLASLFGLDEFARGVSRRTSYPDLRDRILNQGLDSWPAPVSDVGRARPPLPQREMLDQMIKETRYPRAS